MSQFSSRIKSLTNSTVIDSKSDKSADAQRWELFIMVFSNFLHVKLLNKKTEKFLTQRLYLGQAHTLSEFPWWEERGKAKSYLNGAFM